MKRIDTAFLGQDEQLLMGGGGSGGGSLLGGFGSDPGLTIDLRQMGTGSKSIQVTGVSQVITLEVWVTVTGADSNARQGLQSLQGSFVSSYAGAAKGSLAISNVHWHFDANGYSDGVQQDLDGDGDLEIGGSNPGVAEGYFVARSGTMRYSQVGQDYERKVAEVTFTVTQLGPTGQETTINFENRQTETGALWVMDGSVQNGSSGSIYVGAPVVLWR